jgi:hypothetical protein
MNTLVNLAMGSRLYPSFDHVKVTINVFPHLCHHQTMDSSAFNITSSNGISLRSFLFSSISMQKMHQTRMLGVSRSSDASNLCCNNPSMQAEHNLKISALPVASKSVVNKSCLGTFPCSYKLLMTLSNQLRLSKDSLVKALNGKEKSVTMRLLNTVHGSFIFRKLGDSPLVSPLRARRRRGNRFGLMSQMQCLQRTTRSKIKACMIENIFVSFAA